MTTVTFFLVVFLVVSIFFLFIHLLMGHFIRPARPDAEKLTIYECGEPTVGSAWIQFDLRYYVVALLFVIFDVEVAFFFPWAIIYGKATDLARADMDKDKRAAISSQLLPPGLPPTDSNPANNVVISDKDAYQVAKIAMIDIGVFFGVLLVGYAYLWKRGDIDWVKTVVSERSAVPKELEPVVMKPHSNVVVGGAART